jgi:hypothetical protein
MANLPCWDALFLPHYRGQFPAQNHQELALQNVKLLASQPDKAENTLSSLSLYACTVEDGLEPMVEALHARHERINVVVRIQWLWR